VGETRLDVNTTIRDLLDDPRKDFFSDAVVNRAITRANQIVYNLLVKRDPSIFSTESSITWPADTKSLDISGASYLNSVPMVIQRVWETDESGAVGTNNEPQEVLPTSQTALVDAYCNGSGYHSARGLSQLYYSMRGKFMDIAPVPDDERFLKILYVPANPTALDSDSVEVLSGTFPHMHQAVAYCGAYLLLSKQEGQNAASITQLWSAAQSELISFGNFQQAQRNNRVRSYRRK
tara:strand:+ start:10047 stop:10751 length:705 start_codon:yes stop_codon:yes gene_type:complete